MRKIYQKELASKIPVIVYVSPDGARAASAGVWIGRGGGRARDGAADEHRLVDADRRRRREHPERPAPQGRSTTRPRRCARWPRATTATRAGPDTAVRKASNLTAQRGARPERDRLRRADAARAADADRRPQDRAEGPFVLHTAGAEIDDRAHGFWQRMLDTLIDPNLIALFSRSGVLGIIFELWHPGLIFPARSARSAWSIALLRARRAARQLGRARC